MGHHCFGDNCQKLDYGLILVRLPPPKAYTPSEFYPVPYKPPGIS